MGAMDEGQAMDLLRDMNRKIGFTGETVDDGDPDAGWRSGMEDCGDIDLGALPGRPRVKVADAEIEAVLAKVAESVGGYAMLRKQHVMGVADHFYRKGHHQGHKRGFKRAHSMMRDPGVKWGRTRLMSEFRSHIIRKYQRIHQGDIIEGPGFYYGTIEAQFNVEDYNSATNTAQCAAVINVANLVGAAPIVDKCFDLGIGDTSASWLGGPHVLTEADTNLQNPGQSLFADELFIVEAISARVRGARVLYPTAANAIPVPGGGAPLYPQATGIVTQQALNGQCMVWDENGEILPVELWNGLTDYYRLAHALAENATVHFTWQDKGVGGSNRTTDALVDSFLHVPGSHEMNVRRTSGGNKEVLDLPQGYIWCLDKQFQATADQGGNGLFDCEIHLDESVMVPFVPIAPFGATVGGSAQPIAPSVISLYWEVRLLGTSLLPGRRDDGESWYNPPGKPEMPRRAG